MRNLPECTTHRADFLPRIVVPLDATSRADIPVNQEGGHFLSVEATPVGRRECLPS